MWRGYPLLSKKKIRRRGTPVRERILDTRVSKNEPRPPSVVGFLGVVLVPAGNFDHDVGRTVGNRLATQTRFRGDAGRLVEFVELRIGGFVARLEALSHH